MKNADSIPQKFEETKFDVKMKCPRCNKILKPDEPVIVSGPNTYAETSSDSIVETSFQLYCRRCDFQYLGSVQSGIYDTSFIIHPIDDDWYFWVKEIE